MLYHYHAGNMNSIIPCLKINSVPIERVTQFDFLGATIGENLNWNAHTPN